MDAATGGAKTGQLTDGKSMWSALAEDREIVPSDFVTMGMDDKAFFNGEAHRGHNGELQLYDIAHDETESRNLASQRPISLKSCRTFWPPHQSVRRPAYRCGK